MVIIIEIVRKPICTGTLHCSEQKLFVWLVRHRFFHLSDNPVGAPKGNVFLPNSSFLLVETYFLCSRNSIVLFRALLKILKFGGSNLFKRKLISARENCFLAKRSFFPTFQILLLVKGILCLAVTYL